MFRTSQLMVEQQYTELALAGDLVAARIRSLGVAAPGRYAQFARRTSLMAETGTPRGERNDLAIDQRS